MAHTARQTRLAMTAVDQMPVIREKTVTGIMRFLETDTLCFREEPEKYTKSHELTAEQVQAWDPLLDWFAVRPHSAAAAAPAPKWSRLGLPACVRTSPLAA